MNKRRTILITGINSGIGLALAHHLYHLPFNVVATCREGGLKAVRSSGLIDTETFRVVTMDLTIPEQRCTAVTFAGDLLGGVDILINNAAVSYRSTLEDMTDDDNLHQLSTNYLGPVALMRLVLPYMRQQRCGKIINVSSVGGMMAMPTMGAYSASKFALEGASEAFWYEGRPWGISISLVQPGFIRSDSFQHVMYGSDALRRGVNEGPYATCYKEMSIFIERCMTRARATPDSVARRIIELIDDDSPPLRVPVTLDAHFFTWIRRLLPRHLYHGLLYRALPGINSWGREEISSPSREEKE